MRLYFVTRYLESMILVMLDFLPNSLPEGVQFRLRGMPLEGHCSLIN